LKIQQQNRTRIKEGQDRKTEPSQEGEKPPNPKEKERIRLGLQWENKTQ
jgi:hypothetical protein